MDQLAYTYALIKSFHEEGKDYIGSFCPLVLKVVSHKNCENWLSQKNENCTDISIQAELLEKNGLNVPLNTLKSILERLVKEGHLEKKKGKFLLTESGRGFLESLTEEEKIKREINSLLDDLRQHLNNELDESLNTKDTQRILINFIHKNIEPVLELCIDPKLYSEKQKYKIERKEEKSLIKYIETVKDRMPQQYEIMKDLIMGSIISLAFSFDTPIIKGERFKACTVYLDTNILFSILELHFDEFNEPAKELFNLLKDYGFEIRVFDFTVDEATRVLTLCAEELTLFSKNVKVNSICANLTEKKWSPQDIIMSSATIDKKLRERGIKKEDTNLDIEDYTPKNEEIRNKMLLYKPNQRKKAQNHDLLAIDIIKKKRGKKVRDIEDSIAFFLTSDVNLSKFNFIENNHRERGTVCEVILDRLLTTILWLKNPDISLSCETLIASCYKDVFVNKKIWEVFFNTLQWLKKEHRISDKAHSALLFYNLIGDVLSDFDEAEATKIDAEYVLEMARRAEEMSTIINNKTKNAEERLEKLQKDMTAIINKNEDKEKKQKENTRNRADLLASVASDIIAAFISILFLLIFYSMYLLNLYTKYPLLGFLFSIGLGSYAIIYVTWLRIRPYIKTKLSDRFYHNKIEELGLDED